MYTQSPRTLIHHDVQGDNILVAGDGEPSLALIDWQLTTAARPVLDLADFIVATWTHPSGVATRIGCWRSTIQC